MKKLIVMVIGVLLVLPTASVLYAWVGGGALGSALCLLLGVVTYMCVANVVGLVVEGYEWIKYRKVRVEEPQPIRVPEYTAYEIDWTKINKDDRL